MDSSLRGNHAQQTIIAGGWTNGVAGRAYHLPRFSVTNSSDLHLSGAVPVSLSAWVRPNAAQVYYVIAGIEGNNPEPDMYALKGGDKDQLLWNINNGPLVSSTNTLMDYSAASLDGWVHVVGVFDPGVVSAIYINGELDNFKAGSGSIIYHAHPFCIGRYWNGDKYTFNGAIDDVQIYDKALSEEDVLYLFSNPGYGLGMAPPAGTVIIIR